MSDKVGMSRRAMIGASIMVPVAAQARGLGGKRDRRPNILFLLPDQFRFDWLSGNGMPIHTPNIDALASRGIRFGKAVSAAPVCAPSRACLASGREYDQCGVESNFVNYPVSQTTYYTKLRDAGYFVAACGKLDLSKPAHDNGLDGRNHMAEWGFNDLNNCGGKGDAVNKWEEFRTPYEPYMVYMMKEGVADIHAADIHARQKGGANKAASYARTYPTPIVDRDYEDNWIGRVGVDMLRRFPKDKPWHLVVNFAGPHNPEDITETMAKTVRDRTFPQPNDSTELSPREHNAIRQNYTAMVENLDRWVGLYVEELKKRGELDNTIIVFSSDHGEMLGDHNRWAKNVPYEASIGVPLIVCGPNIRHRRSDALVSLTDCAATFLDYAEAERPEDMTALSFRPLLEGKTDKHRDYVRSGLYGWRMVSDGRYKLVDGFDVRKDGLFELGAAWPKDKPRPVILFDLELDPKEVKDFSAAEPDVVARLKPLLAERNPDPAYGVITRDKVKSYGREH